MAIVNLATRPDFLKTLEARVTLRMEIFNMFHIYEQIQLTQIYFLQVFRTEDRTLVQEYTTPAFQKYQLLLVLSLSPIQGGYRDTSLQMDRYSR